jgi:hypothetical protein
MACLMLATGAVGAAGMLLLLGCSDMALLLAQVLTKLTRQLDPAKAQQIMRQYYAASGTMKLPPAPPRAQQQTPQPRRPAGAQGTSTPGSSAAAAGGWQRAASSSCMPFDGARGL